MVGMVIKRSFLKAAAVVSIPALVSSAFYPVGALATPTRLECTLKSAGAGGKETTRKISIVFDAGAKTLDFYQGSQRQELAHVTISTISIDGYTSDMSIGIDTSSWSIVVQTYSPDHTLVEFGVCKPATVPAH